MNGEKISPAIAYVIRTGKKLLADGGTFVGVIHDGHGRSEGNVLFTTSLVSIDMASHRIHTERSICNLHIPARAALNVARVTRTVQAADRSPYRHAVQLHETYGCGFRPAALLRSATWRAEQSNKAGSFHAAPQRRRHAARPGRIRAAPRSRSDARARAPGAVTGP